MTQRSDLEIALKFIEYLEQQPMGWQDDVGALRRCLSTLPESIKSALEFYRDAWVVKPSKQPGLTWHPNTSLLDDCGNKALSALNSYVTNGWLDIGAAPRDGRDLLLTSKSWGGDVVVGGFCFGAWRERPDKGSPELDPTHWMSVPNLP